MSARYLQGPVSSRRDSTTESTFGGFTQHSEGSGSSIFTEPYQRCRASPTKYCSVPCTSFSGLESRCIEKIKHMANRQTHHQSSFKLSSITRSIPRGPVERTTRVYSRVDVTYVSGSFCPCGAAIRRLLTVERRRECIQKLVKQFTSGS